MTGSLTVKNGKYYAVLNVYAERQSSDTIET